MSHFWLFCAAMLLTATGLFYWAAEYTMRGSVVARDICSNAQIFCEHPEWTALAAIGVVIIYVMSKVRRG